MKFDTQYKTSFYLCFVLLIGGCVAPTVQTYQGKKMPSNKIAFIETTESIGTEIKVQKIDEKKTRPDTRKIEVLPGEHHLICYLEHIEFRFPNLYIDEGSPQTLTFKAKAGHVYKVYGKWNSIDDTPMWIVDELTGAVVAGNKKE